jgi:putative SOS response-associated peptidase YedK
LYNIALTQDVLTVRLVDQRRQPPIGKAKQPYYFTSADDKPFAFAGLWERWDKGEGGQIESCTILTTAANDLVKPYHDRMPVILSTSDYDAWLNPVTTDGAKLSYLFEPFPSGEMAARPVNPVVNNARQNVPECIEEVTAE